MLLKYRLLYCKSRTFSTHSLLFQYPRGAFAALTSPPVIDSRTLCDHAPIGAMNTLFVCNIVNYSLRYLNKHK